jgi:hypothetical protein
MSGTSLLCLLVSLVVSLDPAVSVGQATRTPAAAPQSHHVSRIPVRSLALREPGHVFSRFPPSRADSSGLSQLVRAAGTIFSGTVTSITRHPASNGQSVATVSVTFHIENALRGAISGRDFTISEWSGLWSTGQNYHVGERLLVLLYPRSKLGLTSSVAGSLGRFAVDAHGTILLSSQHISALGRDPVLGGKSRLRFSDFALAVRQATEEE